MDKETVMKQINKDKFCDSCAGLGYFLDTTYVRTGEDTKCNKCKGTGLPVWKVNKIIKKAIFKHQVWPPKKSTK